MNRFPEARQEDPTPQDPVYRAAMEFNEDLRKTDSRADTIKFGYSRIEDAVADKHRVRSDPNSLTSDYILLRYNAIQGKIAMIMRKDRVNTEWFGQKFSEINEAILAFNRPIKEFLDRKQLV